MRTISISRRSLLANTAGLAAAPSVLAVNGIAHAQAPAAVVVPITTGAPGTLPSGLTAALTGGGAPVSWQIQEDQSAPEGRALVQTSADRTDYRFPLCIVDGTSLRDVDISVRFKPMSGRVDRAAGLVARLRDANNYYVVRANALENNVNLYKVEAGRRREFAGGRAPVASDRWQLLRLRVQGSQFWVYFEDRQLFEARDATFADAGRIALWTKADSVTAFSQLRYTTPA